MNKSNITAEFLDECYERLIAANAEYEKQRTQTGYWVVNIFGRMPRTKNRRIRNKWIVSGRSTTLRWIPPQSV